MKPSVSRPLPLRFQVEPLVRARVTLFHAEGCHLCERALEVVREVCGDDVQLVDIGGDAALEASYRERIPVVEVDGEPVFTYFVDADALRRRLGG